jgi:hypothetical protein
MPYCALCSLEAEQVRWKALRRIWGE